MKVFFINIGKHSMSTWDAKHLQARNTFVREYNKEDISLQIVYIDMPFPEIDPEWSCHEVGKLAYETIEKIETFLKENNADPDGVHIVHIMGDSAFVYNVVERLNDGIVWDYSLLPVHSTVKGGEFVQFRPYWGSSMGL
jgi:hypothetical protein